jgi:hypothetical protein
MRFEQDGGIVQSLLRKSRIRFKDFVIINYFQKVEIILRRQGRGLRVEIALQPTPRV